LGAHTPERALLVLLNDWFHGLDDRPKSVTDDIVKDSRKGRRRYLAHVEKTKATIGALQRAKQNKMETQLKSQLSGEIESRELLQAV
jgi:hypothetical protein